MDDGPMSVIEWSVAEEPLPGQKQSGDRCLVKNARDGALLAVVDGIGHGEDAAHSAEIVVRTLNDSDSSSPISLLRRCHLRLQGTRGAVLSLAWFNPADDTMTWLGVGDTLIFATDGIRSGFADKLNINASPQEIARNIIEGHWRKIDDALVLVARYDHKSESTPQ
jgi:hypothetical protein